MPKTIFGSGRVCPQVEQSLINQLIRDFFRFYRKKEIEQFISIDDFVFICHKAADTFLDGDVLEEIHDERGVAVIGDIHGSFSDLLKVLTIAGWPTERTLVFLGDYVDRGSRSVEVVLFLFLLKIRYARRVFLLRGNHETVDMNGHCGLREALFERYGSNSTFLFHTLNRAFDCLPIAAVISDQIYCCHGGISEFAVDRSSIRHLARPLTSSNPKMGLIKMLLLTDTLWSDPAEYRSRKDFVPSPRGASYEFSCRALKACLKRLNCRALVRAHTTYDVGLTRIHHGLCYSLHSSRDYSKRSYDGGVLLLGFQKASGLLYGEAVYFPTGEQDAHELSTALAKKFDVYFDLYPMDDPLPIECIHCAIWKADISPKKLNAWRCFSHEDLLAIMKEWAKISKTAMKYLQKVVREHNQVEAAARELPNLIHETVNNKRISAAISKAKSSKSAECSWCFEVEQGKGNRNWPKLHVRGLRSPPRRR